MDHRPRVIAIQHVSAEPLGTLADALAAANIELQIIRVDQREAVPAIATGAHGVVVMGGPMGVYEADRFPFLRDELKLLADAHEREVPILGICLGAQLLAAALGSRVFPSGRQEIGWHPITVATEAKDDPLFRHAPQTFDAFHWHGDTYDLPSGAVRLGSSALTSEQGFRAGRTSYGLQFHLEVTPVVIAAMSVGADADLAAAGVSASDLLTGAARSGAALEKIAHGVFDAWSSLVHETAKSKS